MNDEEQFVTTACYPKWEREDFEDKDKVHKYPPYGSKYLFTTGLVPEPEWPEDDERWLRWNPETVISTRFTKWYEVKFDRAFDGEILFTEPTRLVIAGDIARS